MTQTNKHDSNYDWAQKHSADKEALLLAIIQENSQLPEKNNSGINNYGVSVRMRP